MIESDEVDYAWIKLLYNLIFIHNTPWGQRSIHTYPKCSPFSLPLASFSFSPSLPLSPFLSLYPNSFKFTFYIFSLLPLSTPVPGANYSSLNALLVLKIPEGCASTVGMQRHHNTRQGQILFTSFCTCLPSNHQFMLIVWIMTGTIDS